jgi:hypothetical protein
MYNQMKRCGEKIDETRGRKDSMFAAKKKFYYVVVAIDDLLNMDFLTIKELMGKLQAHKKRVNDIQ